MPEPSATVSVWEGAAGAAAGLRDGRLQCVLALLPVARVVVPGLVMLRVWCLCGSADQEFSLGNQRPALGACSCAGLHCGVFLERRSWALLIWKRGGRCPLESSHFSDKWLR